MRWLWIAIAIGGTALFGASLVRILDIENWIMPAAWLILWTGGAWLLFIPVLAKRAGLQYSQALDHSLEAMALGEAVLAVAAIVNFTGYGSLGSSIAFVAVSNVVMLATLIRAIEKPKAVATTWLVLNVAGAALAVLTLPLLQVQL